MTPSHTAEQLPDTLPTEVAEAIAKIQELLQEVTSEVDRIEKQQELLDLKMQIFKGWLDDVRDQLAEAEDLMRDMKG